jgi:hypothetical protein
MIDATIGLGRILGSRRAIMVALVALVGACAPQTTSTYTPSSSTSSTKVTTTAQPAQPVTTAQPKKTAYVQPVAQTASQTTGSGPSQTFHAVIMVDTQDPQIGNMIVKDLKKMRKYVQKMATLSGLKLSIKEFTADQFRSPMVQAYVDSLTVGSDDVLFFYYSGHGFRYQDQTGVWPYFDMQKPISFGKMIDRMRGKKPRLLLALTDACNKVLEGVAEPSMAFRSGAMGSRGYRTLFRKFKGEILATSSSPGEYSQTSSNGSWFTRDFLMGLELETSSRNPDWHELMEVAGKKKSETYNGVNYFQTPHTVVKVSPIAIN